MAVHKIKAAPPGALYHYRSRRLGVNTHLPWDVHLSQNQVYNRAFIEVFGFSFWKVLLGRNEYERFEKAGESSLYLLMEVATPVIINSIVNHFIIKKLKDFYPKTFAGKNTGRTLMGLPFEFLTNCAIRSTRPKHVAYYKRQLRQAGLKNLPISLAHKLLNAKYGILTTNLLIIGLTNLLMT